jgi:coenzyme F420-0:L-glutamate ligase/coenzyme F420-1:gamma-L-glutamate ligase
MQAPPSSSLPNAAERALLETQRVGRLATVDADGMPHVVPVCYALVDRTLYVVLDEKPKRVAARALKRVRNILANPRAALVVDHYEDADWSRLGWVMARGQAEIVEPGEEHAAALRALRGRYPQYLSMDLDQSLMIALRIEKITRWGKPTLIDEDAAIGAKG